jgi:hypothetical protein
MPDAAFDQAKSVAYGAVNIAEILLGATRVWPAPPPAAAPVQPDDATVAAIRDQWYFADGGSYVSGDPGPMGTLTLAQGQGFRWPAQAPPHLKQLQNVWFYVTDVANGNKHYGASWRADSAHVWTPPPGMAPGAYLLRGSVYDDRGNQEVYNIVVL